MVSNAPLATATRATSANIVWHRVSRRAHHIQQGRGGLAQRFGRQNHRGRHAYAQVDQPGHQQRPEERTRVDAAHIADLLGDIGRDLEADERIERQQRRAQHGHRWRDARRELHDPFQLTRAVQDEACREHHHENQAGHLDERHDHVGAHGLANPSRVEQSDQQEKPQRRGHCRCIEEGAEIIAGEGQRQTRRTGHAGCQHGEADQKREQRAAECALGENRRAARLRVLRDQLRIGTRGEQREPQRHQQRHPDRTAHLHGNLAHQCIDPGAQHVTENEQKQRRAGNGAAQPGRAAVERRCIC